MADSYYTISQIAGNGAMHQRLCACATQQQILGNVPGIEEPIQWVSANSYVWASSPGWAEKWDYATQTHPPVEGAPMYDPGIDAAVITDGDILATVQALGAASTNQG